MTNDSDFNVFCQDAKKASESVGATDAPTLLRKQKKTKTLILQYVIGYKVPANNVYHPVYDYYKPICFVALNAAITNTTAQNTKFSIKNFFSKCDQMRSFLRIRSHLLKKSSMENFIFFVQWTIKNRFE